MRFSVAFGVPEKSVFTRLFCVFATVMLANFQDRLVMTALWLVGEADMRLQRIVINNDPIILSHRIFFVKGYFDVFSLNCF
jgi:hypothetical protein